MDDNDRRRYNSEENDYYTNNSRRDPSLPRTYTPSDGVRRDYGTDDRGRAYPRRDMPQRDNMPVRDGYAGRTVPQSGQGAARSFRTDTGNMLKDRLISLRNLSTGSRNSISDRNTVNRSMLSLSLLPIPSRERISDRLTGRVLTAVSLTVRNNRAQVILINRNSIRLWMREILPMKTRLHSPWKRKNAASSASASLRKRKWTLWAWAT